MNPVNKKGNLSIAGCDAVELAKEFGTPLYVMDEEKIRNNCRRYIKSIKDYYDGNGIPIYASKAFSCLDIYRVVTEEGMDVEVVSGGELYTALKAGVSADKIHFQGNNKSYAELEFAIKSGVGDIVIDNKEEIKLIERICWMLDRRIDISIRIKPGIDAHTHEFIRTGQIDSKFGVALENGEALELVCLCQSCDNINLKGIHCHIGSQIFDIEPFVFAAKIMIDFMAEIKQDFEIEIESLNLGGGFGINYVEQDNAPAYEEYMKGVSKAVYAKCKIYGMKTPKVYIEPGRSIVADAGTTLHTVGNIKEIPSIRNYVSVDGGMYENIRYPMYGAQYRCIIANKAEEPADYKATIVGKCCESSDIIQENIFIQHPEPGDILAVFCTGAYNYSMASNYNRNPRPACVKIKDASAKIIIRRESYEDLIRNDY